MQLLHEQQPIINIGNRTMTADAAKESMVDNHEIKEKKSSNGSLPMMNPVASGDNMATGLNSAHKLKEDVPPLIPCCEGKELQISEDLVHTGLSAISVRHDNGVIQCLSMSAASERMQVSPGLVKHRNSFRCLHRPDLKRVPYLRRMTPEELESLFKGCKDFPPRGNSCDNRNDGSTLSLPAENIIKQSKKEIPGPDDGSTLQPLHPIPEMRTATEDVPEGMRLHGARARLYTSVLAGAKAGDQLDGNVAAEEYDMRIIGDDPLPEDEVTLNEELQIILPPRPDDVAAESSNTTTDDSVLS